MSRPHRLLRTSTLILSVAGIILQAPSAAGQSPVAPPRHPRASDVSSRLAEAAQDPTLAPWQREFMLEMARGSRAEGEPPPERPSSALAPAGSAAEDGEWSELFPSFERTEHTAIYDPVRERMVLFGGLDESGNRNDMWALSLAGSPAWSPLAPEGSPPSSRRGHTAIYDPVRCRMVVFGGIGSNELWALSLAGTPAWSALASAGTPPTGRYGHTAIYDPVRDRMVVFGGSDGSLRNDAWALSLAGSPAWSALAPGGSLPTARRGHTAIYDPVRDRMVVFGGLDDSSGYRNDAWALSLEGSPAWRLAHGGDVEPGALAPAGSLPAARYEHTAFYDPVRDRMVVFGGGDAYGFDDAWALSLAGSPAWSALAPAGSLPFVRFGHTAIYDPVRDRMVAFGGSSGFIHDDVWELSLAGSPAWSVLAPAGGPPAGRWDHTAIYDPVRDRMVVFGGRHWGTPRNDAWTLSLGGSPAWSALAPAGSPPSLRYGHTAIYDPVRDRMVVFGGYDGSHLDDAWALSLAGSPAWSELATSGTTPPGRSFHTAIYDPVRDRMVVFGGSGSSRSDVWALSLAGSPAWSELAPAGTLPPGRAGHSAIYDPVRDRMVVFGGGDWNDRNDTWALSLAGSPAWSDLAPGGSLPMARGGHTAIYDPVRDRMVVFGGNFRDRIYFNDTWALSLAGSPAWIAPAPAGGRPSFRTEHAAIYDPVRDRMVVYAGTVDSKYGNIRKDALALAWGSPTVPALVSLAHAEAEPDRVSLTWYGSESAGLTASVERREETTAWQRLATITADGTGIFRYEDRAVAPGTRYAYRLAYWGDGGAETFTAETWVDVPVTVSLALEGLRPNPAGAELLAVFSLPDDAPAMLAVLDVTGRRLLAREVGSLGAGRHTVRLAGPGELPAGIYWLRLERMGRALRAKAITLR